MRYASGFEFEYALVGSSGRFRDFTDLDFRALQRVLADAEGTDDGTLTSGDLGIKSGYWYLEGDERFASDGTFVDLRVKGVEVRTPISSSLREAADHLLRLQAEVEARVATLGLHLAIAGLNPVRAEYRFEPPLNAWEVEMRSAHHEYDHAEVSNLTYGPDVNLSFPGLPDDAVVDLTRRLTHYSPFLVPFSFSSPFFAGRPWEGPSKRTYERTWRRAAARCFVDSVDLRVTPAITYRPRVPSERGRIEFKAYDAFLSRDLLLGCAALVLGVCLSDSLPGRRDVPDRSLHQRAARSGFLDAEIAEGAGALLAAARVALAPLPSEAAWLGVLDDLLARRRTPADDLLDSYARTGLMYLPGGLC